MNKIIMMGRLTRDPEIRYANNANGSYAIARYTLAVDRKFNREEQGADFFNCVAFGRMGEFAEKYFKKGTKLVIAGRVQTGSYTNRDNVKIPTFDIVIEEQDFAESKNSSGDNGNAFRPAPATSSDGFMNIPDGIDEELPFN